MIRPWNLAQLIEESDSARFDLATRLRLSSVGESRRQNNNINNNTKTLRFMLKCDGDMSGQNLAVPKHRPRRSPPRRPAVLRSQCSRTYHPRRPRKHDNIPVSASGRMSEGSSER